LAAPFLLSLLICGLLIIGTTDQQKRFWLVVDLILVTWAIPLVGALLLLVVGVADQRPWWTRILSTIGVVGLWLILAYLTLLWQLVPADMRLPQPALVGLSIVSFVCLLVGSTVSNWARLLASR
jgi:hypothetical protein